MKKLLFAALLVLSTSAFSYTIGGAYAKLLNCSWGKYGYEYGYIGTYKVGNEIYRIFFGRSYCEH